MSCLPHGHSKILPLFGMKDNSQYMFLRWVKWSKLYSNDLNCIHSAGGFCVFFFFKEKLYVDSISICGVLWKLFKVLNMPLSSSSLTRGNFHNGWHIRTLLKEIGSDSVLSRRSNSASGSCVTWYHNFFIYSSVSRFLGCFHVLAM